MKIHRNLSVLLLLVLLSACATVPQTPPNRLAQARDAVMTAAQNEAVHEYAPVELDKAKQKLAAAEAAWDNGNITMARHRAYLAWRHAQIAQAKAVKGKAEAFIAQADERRSELVTTQQQSRIEELEDKLSELNPRQTDRGIVLTIGNVLFAFDSAELSAAAREPLNKLASYMRNNPRLRVRVEGYTDSIGSQAYNQQLSEARAQSVANAMIDRGVAPGRMTVVGYGETNPVAPNTTEYGRQQNRRVNFVILNTGNTGASESGIDGSQ